MNKNNLLMLGLLVGAALMWKRAQARPNATPGARLSDAASHNTSINDQLWRGILGGGWNMLKDATNADGSPVFAMKNWLGQTVTSDGKPIGEELQDIVPTTYGDYSPIDLTGASDGVDYLGKLGLGY